jgi:hypothetical protein
MNFKSLLKPSESTMAAAATVGFVIAVYQMNTGNVAQIHASDANHPILESSRKKAGYTALAGVAALFLLTRDANVGILGGGTIIAMEVSTRHAIMVHPQTGKLTAPGNSAYEPNLTVVPEPDDGADAYTGTEGR